MQGCVVIKWTGRRQQLQLLWSVRTKQNKVSFDDGARRSLCAFQIAWYIIRTECTLLIKITCIDTTSVSITCNAKVSVSEQLKIAITAVLQLLYRWNYTCTMWGLADRCFRISSPEKSEGGRPPRHPTTLRITLSPCYLCQINYVVQRVWRANRSKLSLTHIHQNRKVTNL